MGEEEFTEIIYDLDALLMQIHADMQANNNSKALIRVKQARAMVADMQMSEDALDVSNILK
ncbi:MAG: hypothetical protein ACP5NV_05735 [Candidatus Woesearchaeota archaeon]